MFFPKDDCFTRDLQSTIPGDYDLNGLWLPGTSYTSTLLLVLKSSTLHHIQEHSVKAQDRQPTRSQVSGRVFLNKAASVVYRIFLSEQRKSGLALERHLDENSHKNRKNTIWNDICRHVHTESYPSCECLKPFGALLKVSQGHSDISDTSCIKNFSASKLHKKTDLE